MAEIIFELGHNFNGNIRHAKTMLEEVKACGGTIAKVQLYDTDKIKKPWQSRYFELKFSEINFDEAKELKEYCDKLGIEFLATPFDKLKVEWCEHLGVKRYKLASRSIYDNDLIEVIEKTGKPIIASLGAWKELYLPNIQNCKFLYCIAEYPTYIRADDFPKTFSKENYSGFSDHTVGTYWAREAIKRGAEIVEKHFTLSLDMPGHDIKGSMTPKDAKDLVQYAKQIERGITF